MTIEFNGIKYYNYLSMNCEYKKCDKPIVENTDINGKNYCKRHYNLVQKQTVIKGLKA